MAQGKVSNATKAYIDRFQQGQVTEIKPRALAPESASRGEASLRHRVAERRGRQMQAPHVVDGENRVVAFVSVNDGAAISQLEAQGCEVVAQYGNVVTVDAPLAKLASIAETDGVKSVSVSRKIQLKTDAQRTTAKVDQVHSGTGLAMPYTGAGVVVGVIDVGIDYNHMAFKDADGNSRVVRVFKPSTFKTINIGGKTIKGIEYSTPEEIAKLTCDYQSKSHGTHTSAIAAGTKVGEFGGMAPGADIVLCGMGDDLTDASILNAVDYVFTYAESVGKPAVVNMSLGDHAGAHDGTSDFCQALDQLAGDGKVCVASAGNEGGINIHFGTTFANEGTSVAQGTVVLSDAYLGGTDYESVIDIWAANSQPFTLQYVVVDANGKILTLSPKQNASSAGTAKFNMSTHTTFKNYYTGTATAYFGEDANNGKYNVYVEIDAKSVDKSFKGYLGFVLYGPKDLKVNGWAMDEYTDILAFGKDGIIDGDSEMSISAMVTGDNVISVGAFASKVSYKGIDGREWSYSLLNEGDIVSFSSYGPDANGVQRPDVVGAGATIISAVNGYDTATAGSSYMAAKATDGAGKTHYWGDMMGTSMSSPQVAGILALWLQVNPNLSVSDVREVFESTSIQDSYVTGGPAKKWGYGKIDAIAGIKQVIASGVDNVKADDDNVAIYPNPCDGNFEVFAPGEQSVEVGIYSVSGMLVQQLSLPMAGGSAQVSLAGKLSPGVYLVSVEGSKLKKTTRLIVK